MAVKGMDTTNLKMNVVMKDGTQYRDCDVPQQPQGAHERVVAFWFCSGVRAVPLQDVEYFEYYEDESPESGIADTDTGKIE